MRMTVIIEGIGIDTKLFCSCFPNARMRLVNFVYRSAASGEEISLPVLFRDRGAMRRFWNGYLKGMERRWSIYEVKGYEASFSRELYDRILRDAYMTENRETRFRVPRKRIS